MSKKEKYINYVVEDLISNTEIDYDQEKIKYPFLTYSYSNTSLTLPPQLLLNYSSPNFPFANHVRKVYGAHSEEIEIIWKLYKERIKDKLNNG
jgi:hypothetical protein